MNSSISVSSLECQEYVERVKRSWSHPPKLIRVVEVSGHINPFFKSKNSSRFLGARGRLLDHQDDGEIAEFATIEEAALAAGAIPNRRQGFNLEAVPIWRVNQPGDNNG